MSCRLDSTKGYALTCRRAGTARILEYVDVPSVPASSPGPVLHHRVRGLRPAQSWHVPSWHQPNQAIGARVYPCPFTIEGGGSVPRIAQQLGAPAMGAASRKIRASAKTVGPGKTRRRVIAMHRRSRNSANAFTIECGTSGCHVMGIELSGGRSQKIPRPKKCGLTPGRTAVQSGASE